MMAYSLWYIFRRLDLDSTSGDYIWARLVQGFGLAFVFVPTLQLAYSYLSKSANNKASSLTNLFRNLGGSVGIAFVTTTLARRSQHHQGQLVDHIRANNPIYLDRVAQTTNALTHAGLDPRANASKFWLTTQPTLSGLDAFSS